MFALHRSILRVLKKKLVRLPTISPSPDQVELSNDTRKVLQAAVKLQKKRGDTYLGADILLLALLDCKDISSTLAEAGTSKSKVETALEEVRPKAAKVDSATADDQFEALAKYGVDLTAMVNFLPQHTNHIHLSCFGSE